MSLIYYQDKNQKEVTSEIISLYHDAGRCCIQLKDTIFYPQGGGQKGDRGELLIDGVVYQIVNTVKDSYSNDSVLIVEPEVPETLADSEVKAILNWNFRYNQMKLHTCVHLHHYFLEQVAGTVLQNPTNSVIEDGFAFNRYENNTFDISIIDEANARFHVAIKQDISVITYPDLEKEGYRWWECLGYKIPCGGIHVSNLNEIGNIEIKSSLKKGKITIKFTLV